MSVAIDVGEKAPGFTLPDQQGKEISLSSFAGKYLVLYFYPKDFTPGCTSESCGFRDSYEEFQNLNCHIIGISKDSSESHERFIAEYKLPFTLLSDEDNHVRILYEVRSTFGIIPGRASYLIDPEGAIRHYYASQTQATRHVTEMLLALKNLIKSKA